MSTTGQQPEDRNINDLFDDILLTEERLAKTGYDEGFAEGRAQGNQEGYQLGYSQGVQLGEELGGIYGEVIALQQEKHTDKVQRTLQQLKESIESFPRDNNPEEDIIAKIEHIRTLSKRVHVMLGVKSTKNDSKDVSTSERKDFSF